MDNTENDLDPLWQQARRAVAEQADVLGGLTEHGHLYGWAVLRGLGGPQLWPRVKHELRDQLGIDFDQLRATAHASRRAAIAHADKGPHLRVWAAGDHAQQSFAICGPRGVLWYNNLALDDWWYRGDQPTAELSAAHRAVWIAGRARTLAKFGAARLTLYLTDPGIHAELLAGTAERARVALIVESVAVQDNPAVEWCRKPGHRVCTDLPEFVDSPQRSADVATQRTSKPRTNKPRKRSATDAPSDAEQLSLSGEAGQP